MTSVVKAPQSATLHGLVAAFDASLRSAERARRPFPHGSVPTFSFPSLGLPVFVTFLY